MIAPNTPYKRKPRMTIKSPNGTLSQSSASPIAISSSGPSSVIFSRVVFDCTCVIILIVALQDRD